jgi:PPP family 3-phenylpropionic acid transporter
LPPSLQSRCALAYAAAVGVNGIILPYFPIWLNGLSFSPFEIGVVLAAQMILRVIAAPLAGLMADRMPERSFMLVWAGGLSLVTAVALFWTSGFWAVLVVFSLQSAAFAPFMPIVEAITVTGVRRWGLQYGRMRVWGSVGFVCATLSVGALVTDHGADVVPAAISLVFVLAIVAALLAPRLGRMGVTSAIKPVSPSALRRVDLHLLMCGASLIQASHGMYYAFSTLHWREVGFSTGSIGVLWATGVIAEITVFFMAGRIARRIGASTLIRFGGAVAIARWAFFPADLSFAAYLALQLTHAFTFAFVHVGLQSKMVDMVQEEQESAAQGAYIFYNGVLLGAATILSGIVYRQYGSAGYFVMSLIAAIGLVIAILAERFQPQRSASGG